MYSEPILLGSNPPVHEKAFRKFKAMIKGALRGPKLIYVKATLLQMDSHVHSLYPNTRQNKGLYYAWYCGLNTRKKREPLFWLLSWPQYQVKHMLDFIKEARFCLVLTRALSSQTGHKKSRASQKGNMHHKEKHHKKS